MADITHVPFATTRVSTLGYTFEIVEVAHTYRASEATVIEVDPSASHAVHVPTAGQTAVTVTFDSSADTSTFGKTLSIPATSATGNYTFVIRHAGEAGGYKGDL